MIHQALTNDIAQKQKAILYSGNLLSVGIYHLSGETPLREKAPDGEINVSGCMPYSLIQIIELCNGRFLLFINNMMIDLKSC